VSQKPSRQPHRNFRPDPYPYHHELELRIKSLSNLGQGVARDGESAWVIFVPSCLPGELVRARIYRNHASYSEADLLEVLEPSKDRIEPKCSLFGICGGCQYQNLSYEAQLAWKRDQVAEVLARTGGITALEVEAPMPSPLEYGYRSKITPHFKKPRDGKITEIGFLQSGSRSHLVDVPHCPIASDAINEALPAIREAARDTCRKAKKGVTLLIRDADGTIVTNPKTVAHETVGDLKFSFLAGDFFQNNPSILPEFTKYVAGEASQGGLRYLVDAYCGSGLFALTCAKSFERVIGVEISETSADWARLNANQNGIENATFLAASAEKVFDDLDIDHYETTVLIDPPRKGSSPEFLEQLLAFGPRRVVYVSCNPATQARDLIAFTEGGYHPTRCLPFDLFPQTKHLECVITLEKNL